MITDKVYGKVVVADMLSQTTLNNSLPVEQYACDELLKTYRDCLKDQLLPEMDRMYRDHCHKIDTALKDWAHRYSTGSIRNTLYILCIQYTVYTVYTQYTLYTVYTLYTL